MLLKVSEGVFCILRLQGKFENLDLSLAAVMLSGQPMAHIFS